MKLLLICLTAFVLGACGNTVSGIGKDITDVGNKITKWQSEDNKDAK